MANDYAGRSLLVVDARRKALHMLNVVQVYVLYQHILTCVWSCSQMPSFS